MAARPMRHQGRGFLNCQHKDADGTLAKYGLFLPHAYDDRRPWPLILFLHGAGETGDDGQRQMEVGLGPAVRRREGRFPSLVVFPQSPLRTWQADTPDARRALAIVGNVRKKFNVDASRIYLTGLSMGGFGVWSLAARHPRRWAALVPVCGGGNPKNARKIKDIPCWCFHGARDEVVPVQRSREMIETLRAAGGRPKYTEYEDVAHNSWDPAYAHRGLFAWLFKQRRKA